MITNRSLLAALLATALALPLAPALAGVNPLVGGGGGGGGMNTDASNAVLPTARNNLGAAAGNGANVVKDYGADPTGAVDATTAFQTAIDAACNNASPVFQSKAVFIPGGLYTLSAKISVTNGCWIHGQGELQGGKNAAGTVLRTTMPMAGDLFEFKGFGQFRLSDLRIDTTGGYQSGGASYCRVQAAGSGYALDDTITLTGGTFSTATVLKVTALSGSGVTGCVITTPGVYSVAPSAVAAVAQGSSSGAGTGATFNMVYANSAAVSLSGPKTTLTADAASGATSLTVASIAGFANGNQISIEQDNGVYKTTTISGAPSGTTIVLAAGLTFKASANHPVYNTYASAPLIENLTCISFWDCIRNENAARLTVSNSLLQDYGHDGIIIVQGANPDNGGHSFAGTTAWDQNRGTSNAGLEVLAGGAINASGSYFQRSNYSVLVNSFFGPTGTLLLGNISAEGALICSVRLHQAVSGIEYANVSVQGGEFSNVSSPGLSAQHFCVDAGTPDTNPKWVRNIVFANNHANSYISAAVALVSVQDGDNIVVSGNALNNNNTAGPTGISVGGAATRVTEIGNQITLFPSGAYGTMATGSLSPVVAKGALSAGGAFTYALSLLGSNSYPILAAASGATGIIIKPNDDGSKAVLRIDPVSSTSTSLSAVDATGVGAYQELRLNGSVISLRNAGSQVGTITATGLNSVAIGATTPAAGNFTTLGATGAITGQVKTLSKTSAYPVVAGDSGTHFDNIGAGGSVTFTLPAAAAGLHYCFLVSAAQTVVVTVQTGEKIAIGATNSAASGNITATTAFASTCLEAHAASQWVASAMTGSWAVN